jgi:hypothetical protein
MDGLHKTKINMSDTYIEQHTGGYRVIGTRISLDSIVYAVLRGETAESRWHA